MKSVLSAEADFVPGSGLKQQRERCHEARTALASLKSRTG